MTNKEREQYAKDFARTNRKFQKSHFPKVKKQLDKVVSSLIGTIKRIGINSTIPKLRTQLWNDELYKPIENIYKSVGVYYANQSYKLIRREAGQKGLGRDEQWINFIIDELEKTLLQFAVVKTSETLRNHLLLVLQDAVRNEKSVDEVVKILENSGFTAMQAERIVRTEVGRAANTGIKAAADSFNYEMVKEWIAFRDSRTRGFKPEQPKDHYHMDGQVVDFYDNFVDPRSGENIEYPLAPGGSAAMVINCRCSYIVVPKRDTRGRLINRGGA
jgi:hypothetical protein